MIIRVVIRRLESEILDKHCISVISRGQSTRVLLVKTRKRDRTGEMRIFGENLIEEDTDFSAM
jgi:hypothetical protein